MKNIQDKVVVITGASSGIGKETARLLVSKGAKVMLFARRKEQLEELVSELGQDNCGYVTGGTCFRTGTR
ncbi:short-chain dehydrogenase/reductase SDR [Listeria fleischmannii subsp. coloradonensis]|nr:SDR family NAD(P)-dependent oxidoreductase [Listeria fleischmannii]EIA20543.1 short-chain dehydrogenase/reductase SDR [Listeria fleischmannii subsp. coloradonensis]